MSNSKASAEGTHGQTSLTKAVEDVSQHGVALAEALREKQATLAPLQLTLSDVEKKGEEAARQLRSEARELLLLEGETGRLERQAQALRDRCASAAAGATRLRAQISEEEERARAALARFSAYRAKMEGHRQAVSRAASQTEAHRELEGKRALVRALAQAKEKLRENLRSPNEDAVQAAERDVDALKREIAATRRAAAERREQLREECASHWQMKKDTEVLNRRHEAIVKRLRCQLSKAQAVHRQMSGDIDRMRGRIAELKRQLEPPQDSGVSTH